MGYREADEAANSETPIKGGTATGELIREGLFF